MEVFEMVTIVVALGCATGVVTTFIEKAFGGKQKQAQIEAKMAHERAQLIEAQLIESRRQNDQLQKQLEWHTKMLATQESLMQRARDTAAEKIVLPA